MKFGQGWLSPRCAECSTTHRTDYAGSPGEQATPDDEARSRYTASAIELSAPPRPRINPHPPTMQLHDFLAQRQAEPRSAFADPPAQRARKYALAARRRCLSIIFDTDNDPLAVASGLQTDEPTTGGVAKRIVDQVIEHTVQLRLWSACKCNGPAFPPTTQCPARRPGNRNRACSKRSSMEQGASVSFCRPFW